MTDLTTAPVASDIEDNDITMLVRIVNGIDTLYQVPASVIRGEIGPKGVQGDIGPQGDQGVRGSTWFFGQGSPSNSITPILNDLYYDTNTCDIYEYNSDEKWVIIGNIRGIQGQQGSPGSKWYIGEGPPILSNINDYDLYIDYSTGNTYQYLNGAWSSANINLKGPKGDQGDQGLQGLIGSQWYYGNGSPTITNAQINDMYLDINTSNVYSYNNSAWSKIGNIKGSQGPIGSQWYTGTGIPSNSSTYSIHDFYLNNLTSDVYNYTSSGWVKISNIQGDKGDQGIQGIQGVKGDIGSVWYYGNVSPPALITNEKDLYLNGLNGDVYQYISNIWVKIGNIRGPSGTFTNDGSDDININNATLYNSSSLRFSSNGDNSTIDSEIYPSDGIAGTPYQGSLYVNANLFSIKNQFNSDQGKIKSDGNGDLSVLNLSINGENAITQNDISNFIPSNVSTNEQKITNFYWSNGSSAPEVKYNTNSSAYLALKTDLSKYVLLNGGNNILGEQHFAANSFADPDSGVVRDAKFGQDGIAVLGGIKTDSIQTNKIDYVADSSNNALINFAANGSSSNNRWLFGINGGDTGSNNGGSDIILNRYADNSSNGSGYLGTVFTISRSTGETTFNSPVTIHAAASIGGTITTGGGIGLNFLAPSGTNGISIVNNNGLQIGGNTTVNGALTVTKTISFDNATISSDGSGNLTSNSLITKNIISSGTISFDNATISSDGSGNLTSNSLITKNIISSGTISFNNGIIKSDSNGNLTSTGLFTFKNPSDVPGSSTGNNGATTYWVDANYLPLKGGTAKGTISSNNMIQSLASDNTSFNILKRSYATDGANYGVLTLYDNTAWHEWHFHGDGSITNPNGNSFLTNGDGNIVNGSFTIADTLNVNSNIYLTSSDGNNHANVYVDNTGSGVTNPDLVIHINSNYFIFRNDGALSIPGTFIGTAQYAEYGDLAELYTSKEDYEPGTFVKISEDEMYEIEEAIVGDYLFGVISTNPGILINSKNDGLPVALTGRVPAKIIGPVKKGQPITISNKEGIGIVGNTMIIGFALETNLDENIKLVEIAIGGRS